MSQPTSGALDPPSSPWRALGVEELQVALPQFEVIEMLGRGGMGAVYKARQKSLKRWVAIKVLPLGGTDGGIQFVERFQIEAQTMAQLSHPAIVAVHDFGETADGLFYLVMEFVDGTDVQRMIHASGKLDAVHALAITAHVCDALHYAHTRGVIHRDIKPANILITQEGQVKVADFGLAKVHDPSVTSGLTRSSMLMGTPDYAAPEVLLPGTAADHRADLYAVGVTLYHMLTGRLPRGMFKMPSERVPGLDERFNAIICRSMEDERDDRYPSAMDLRRDLDAIRTTPLARESAAVTPLPTASLPRAVEAAAPQPSGKTISATSMNRRLVAAAAVILLGVAAFVLVNRDISPDSHANAKASPSHPNEGVVDAAFLAKVAAAPPEEQVALVLARIKQINRAEINAIPEYFNGKVVKLTLQYISGTASDLSPVAALRDLTAFSSHYFAVRDFSFLRGLRLEHVDIQGAAITDISVLAGMPLKFLILRNMEIRDFSVLRGMKLEYLDLNYCHALADISFVKGMPLATLTVTNTKVRDLSPIAGLPLVNLTCDPETRLDPTLARSIPTLQTINGTPVAEHESSRVTPDDKR